MARIVLVAIQAEGETLSMAEVVASAMPALAGAPPAAAPAPLLALPAPAEALPAAPRTKRRSPVRKNAEPETATEQPVTATAAATNGKVDTDLLRAVRDSDGCGPTIEKNLGVNPKYRLQKARDAGFVETDGIGRGLTYRLSAAGLAAIGAKAASNGTQWTAEARSLWKLLRGSGSLPVDEATDRLGWTKNVFERASKRPDFRISDGLISLAK